MLCLQFFENSKNSAKKKKKKSMNYVNYELSINLWIITFIFLSIFKCEKKILKVIFYKNLELLPMNYLPQSSWNVQFIYIYIYIIIKCAFV